MLDTLASTQGSRLAAVQSRGRTGIAAAEHGQLPHRPVTVVVVSAGTVVVQAHGVGVSNVGELNVRELQRGHPAVAHDVVHLLGDLLLGQGGQVGQGLEEPAQAAPDERISG